MEHKKHSTDLNVCCLFFLHLGNDWEIWKIWKTISNLDDKDFSAYNGESNDFDIVIGK